MRALLPLLVLAAVPALAQERPVMLPTRDVDVTYRANRDGESVDQRWRYRSEDQRLRLDLPAPGNYMIIDRRAHAAALVSDVDRGVLDMPMPNTDPAGFRPGQTFTRLGGAVVVGVPCTEWQTKDLRGQETVACLTGDGVLLRARHGEQTIVQALRVDYGPIDPSIFAIPSGYRHEAVPRRN